LYKVGYLIAHYFIFIDSKNDFIIDLDNVWKWLDFCQKQRAKELLEKNFVEEKDYKCLLTLESEQKKVVVAIILKNIF